MADDKTEYRDESHINVASDVDQSKVPSTIKKLATWIRQKMYGEDVRESIARGIEKSSEVAQSAVDIANDTASRQDEVDQSQKDFEDRYNDQIAGNTDLDEVIDARKPINKPSYATLGARLNDMPSNEDVDVQVDDSIDIGGELDPQIKNQLDSFALGLPKSGFKVLIVTDSHYEDLYDKSSPYGYPYAYDALQHLSAVNYLSQYVDVVIAGGDNTNGLNEDVSHNIADQDLFSTKILETETKADKFILLGNHDDGSTAIRLGTLTSEDVVKTEDFKKLYRTTELRYGEQRDDGSLYFYKDYPDSKIRLIGLDGLDIPESTVNDDGSIKYTRYFNYSYSQAQIDWLASEALRNIPDGYQIIVTTHIPLVYDFSPNAETTWTNGNILEGLLNAVATGSSFTGKSEDGTPSELQAIVAADFTTQGPRKVAGLWAGHVHTEKITKRDNFTQCLFINDCNTDPNETDTIGALGLTVATVDPASSTVTLSGLGRATNRSYTY